MRNLFFDEVPRKICCIENVGDDVFARFVFTGCAVHIGCKTVFDRRKDFFRGGYGCHDRPKRLCFLDSRAVVHGKEIEYNQSLLESGQICSKDIRPEQAAGTNANTIIAWSADTQHSVRSNIGHEQTVRSVRGCRPSRLSCLTNVLARTTILLIGEKPDSFAHTAELVQPVIGGQVYSDRLEHFFRST